ncbi:MAG: hypothetical protein ACR2LF_04725 [Jatrophihabitantaceae bacterium]
MPTVAAAPPEGAAKSTGPSSLDLLSWIAIPAGPSAPGPGSAGGFGGSAHAGQRELSSFDALPGWLPAGNPVLKARRSGWEHAYALRTRAALVQVRPG